MGLSMMKSRLNVTGSTARETKINNARCFLKWDFRHDASYRDSVYRWIVGENPQIGEQVDIKLYSPTYSAANGNTIKFLVQYDTSVEVGDYFYDKNEDRYWICTEQYNKEDVNVEGKLTECNWFLRWQKDDGTIVEYPTQFVDNTQYNSGVTWDSATMIGTGQYGCILQCTDEVLAVNLGHRFYISKIYNFAYELTRINTVTQNYGSKGIVRFTFAQDPTRNEADRPDLGICDYFEPTTVTKATTDVYAVTLYGGGVLNYGRSQYWTSEFKDRSDNVVDVIPYAVKTGDTITDADGNVVTDVTDKYIWNIDGDVTLSAEMDGLILRLRTDDEDDIDSQFTLQILYNDDVMAEKVVGIGDIL